MMQIRCQYCKWMFTLGREALAQALAEAQAQGEHYHMVDCPKCRHAIKLQVKEMRRRLPPDYPLPDIAPATSETPAANQKAKAEPTPGGE